MKQASNPSASSSANTRLNVSCDAMPLANGSNLRSQSSFSWPHADTSTQSSAAALIAHNAVSSNSCSG
jgi:hypothetical protein